MESLESKLEKLQNDCIEQIKNITKIDCSNHLKIDLIKKNMVQYKLDKSSVLEEGIETG